MSTNAITTPSIMLPCPHCHDGGIYLQAITLNLATGDFECTECEGTICRETVAEKVEEIKEQLKYYDKWAKVFAWADAMPSDEE